MSIGQAPGLAGFGIALICAGLMGYAIQRGATCTVAAVEEIVRQRRATRLIAIVEASVWVTGGLLLAAAFDLLRMQPANFAVTGWTVLGGALLGYGAYVNRACVFGAVARIGSGEWAYVMTPLGFFSGCWAFVAAGAMVRVPSHMPSPVFAISSWLGIPLAIFALLRLGQAVTALRGRAFAAHVWSPHHATAVIGITFVILLLTAGAWAYTDALAQIARGMVTMLGARFMLLLALFAGAIIGGRTAGRLSWTAPTSASLLRCFAGGALMGVGSSLIPGGNDGLILIGLPLLHPFAWVAFVTMCVTIAAAMLAPRLIGSKAT